MLEDIVFTFLPATKVEFVLTPVGGNSSILVSPLDEEIVLKLTPALKGDKGDAGDLESDFITDPTAYYILAKN